MLYKESVFFCLKNYLVVLIHRKILRLNGTHKISLLGKHITHKNQASWSKAFSTFDDVTDSQKPQ